ATSLYEPERQVWKRGVPDRPEVCLTFDDGPHISCESLLDTLKARGVKATFFVVGNMVEKHPDQVRRMIAEGHEVGNHTYDHKRLNTLKPDQVHVELAACADAVRRAAGVNMTFMRPPGMRLNDAVIAENRRFGYILMDWTIGAKDFIGNTPTHEIPPSLRDQPNATPELVRERVAKQLKNGAIILLHDNPVTAKALPGILDDLAAKGYSVKSATEMMAELPQRVNIVANPRLLTSAKESKR
ncbi:MAG: hypothetical protein C4320_07905, partial [Armatimonadota bacterium]